MNSTGVVDGVAREREQLGNLVETAMKLRSGISKLVSFVGWLIIPHKLQCVVNLKCCGWSSAPVAVVLTIPGRRHVDIIHPFDTVLTGSYGHLRHFDTEDIRSNHLDPAKSRYTVDMSCFRRASRLETTNFV